MSYVRKAKKGFYGVAVYRDENGKRRQKSAGCFKLKREAVAAAVALEKKLGAINQSLKDISLADYYQRWYDLYEKDGISKVTQNRYTVIGNVLKKYWKDTKLRTIKQSDYQAFINWYGNDHARDSVVKLNGTVRSAVGYAMDDVITKDFTHNVKNVKLIYSKGQEQKVEYLTTDELQTLKKAVVSKLNRYNTSRYMILTAIYTGMRKSEIQALTWKDVDFLHSTISVTRSWDEKKK
ncbi:tyrosine-type recombinase/integrase, partial [Limosilactobacillus fermentum]|uniref:tyrosine-type recombinase/integrase n=1 Tax=Limosilactobacillus fermentum TaxID=1613 RepID=UPI00280ACC40